MKRARVLVTRQPEQARSLRDGLLELGADVVEIALIEVVPPADPVPLDTALDDLACYDWVAFTSGNAVRAVAARLEGRPWPPQCRIASVGPATSAAVVARLTEAAVTLQPPEDHRAEGLLQEFAGQDMEGRRVLLPLSARARDVLAGGLRARGAHVKVVTAYQTLAARNLPARLQAALAGGIDLVTFASPSAVEGFVAAVPFREHWPAAAVIGPVTESAARAAGFAVAAVAAPSTAEGLVASVARWMRD